MSDIDDILNKDSIEGGIDDIAKDVKDNFDEIESIVLVWKVGEHLQHRAYGTTSEVIGLMEKAKYIMLRENLGETTERSNE